MGDREPLLKRAVNFMIMPKVQAAPLADRIAFLQGKGFTDAEIQEVLKRAEQALKERSAGSSTPEASSSAVSPAATRPTIKRSLAADGKESETVVVGGMVVLSLAGKAGASSPDVASQMKDVLERLDKALESSGAGGKSRLVSLMVFVQDAGSHAAAVHDALDAWVDPKDPPTRTVAELGHSRGGGLQVHVVAKLLD